MTLTDRLHRTADAAASLGYHATAGIARDLAAAVKDDSAGSHRQLEDAMVAALTVDQ